MLSARRLWNRAAHVEHVEPEPAVEQGPEPLTDDTYRAWRRAVIEQGHGRALDLADDPTLRARLASEAARRGDLPLLATMARTRPIDPRSTLLSDAPHPAAPLGHEVNRAPTSSAADALTRKVAP